MPDRNAGQREGPEDAFSLIGDETRVEIIRTLGDAREEPEGSPAVPFAELRAALPARTDSSRFDYHLQQLTGQFIEEVEDGYRLRPEGWTLYRTLQAGPLDHRHSSGETGVGVDCYFCHTEMTASATDGKFRVECPGCGYRYDSTTRVPAAALGDDESAVSRIGRYNQHKRLAFTNGVCPTCASAVDAAFVSPENAPFDDSRREVYVTYRCERCGTQELLSVGEAFRHDPGLVAFCHDHGVDYSTTPVWEIEFAATDRFVTVTDRDPWEVLLQVPLDEETFELRIDGDVTVTERNRF
ncbi:MAG: ArsR family transcriptional regulator [Halolamina sp.]